MRRPAATSSALGAQQPADVRRQVHAHTRQNASAAPAATAREDFPGPRISPADRRIVRESLAIPGPGGFSSNPAGQSSPGALASFLPLVRAGGHAVRINSVYVCLAALLLYVPLVAQSGKLPDAEFRKVAQSHSVEEHQRLASHLPARRRTRRRRQGARGAGKQCDKAVALAKESRHYAGHSREAAEALRNLAKIHQDLAKEHAGK